MDVLNCNGKILDLRKPVIMGILNVTPDSFYDGSKYESIENALTRTMNMIEDGADIIDIGASSSRPGAKIITADEEWKRLQPILEEILNQFPHAILSIDTFWSEVAEKSIKLGVSIINDISAFSQDSKLLDVIADANVPYVLMHMIANPSNMQKNIKYKDVVNEIMLFFVEKIRKMEERNITDIIIDPGFGFGKSVQHNYEILRKLNVFRLFEKPILAGLSRKSMIYGPLDIKPEEALPGTIGLNMLALNKGASILRVHDVKEAKQIVDIHNLV